MKKIEKNWTVRRVTTDRELIYYPPGIEWAEEHRLRKQGAEEIRLMKVDPRSVHINGGSPFLITIQEENCRLWALKHYKKFPDIYIKPDYTNHYSGNKLDSMRKFIKELKENVQSC